MYGLLIPPEPIQHESIQRVFFESPEDIFSKQACTIIGACIEKDLVYMGLKSGSGVANKCIPPKLLEDSVFEHTNGPILVIKTDKKGDPVDTISFHDLH